ncbi:DinB family protein [Ulvibacterium sp.]|uniref:DinB family protein n=1 Tax=Ulvibacterium sp. TaxID=2665914 RepID=UPI002613D8CC|nr:DinB family protein [Ulvibacterium sp.]
MPPLLITSENQIQRLNLLMKTIGQLQELDISKLTTPPKPKAWSVLEIIEHLSIAYTFYVEKIDAALAKSPERTTENEVLKARAWQKLIIKGQRPKEGKRQWKMKTLQKFEPIFSNNLSQEQINEAFEKFNHLYDHLKQSILNGRQKEVSKTKVSSAIGPIVTFYLPECFEFLLSHAERHLVQIQETLDSLS